MNQLRKIEGCTIETLDNVACQAYVKWVIERLKPDENLKDIAWLLAHCHDGVTWGLFDNIINDWLLSSTPFPKLCPRISASNLLEFRLFGLEREILIWRTESGFSGRSMVDKPGQKKNDPCRPDDEIRILLGDQVMDTTKDGFTRVRTKSGMEQAIPLEYADKDCTDGHWPFHLKMRHYFEEDQKTGVVRVAASRLVNVFKEV